MKKLYLLLVALIVTVIPGVAQTWTITGKFNG